jgi:hypothetical protein
MAGTITITVDPRKASEKLNALPSAVRDNLRSLMPLVATTLSGSINQKLDTELKSQGRLRVKAQMREGARDISVTVSLVADPGPRLLPDWLEHGTRAHPIYGKPFLAFDWEKLGKHVVFRSVQHPGTQAYQFMARSLEEVRGDVLAEIGDVVKKAVRSVT